MPPFATPAGGERLLLRRQGGADRRRIEMPLSVTTGASPAPLPGAMLPLPNLPDPGSSPEAPEDDASSAFDVPAFLRRQEG